MKLKNNVCSNLISKTSKYRLDVSQLSHQCFTGFLLSLLSKKSKHFFFRKFFGKWPKIIFRVLGVNCKKACDHLLHMFWGVLDKNLSHFANISLEKIDFEVWNCEKSSDIWRSRIVQSPDQKKLMIKVWHTTVTLSVKIWAQFDIPSGRR
jgi:hypothetical protein